MAELRADPLTDPRRGSLLTALFVDLDGTLIKTDLLGESLVLAVKHQPRILWQSLGWLRRGRAFFKRVLAERVMPDPRHLPYRENVLRFITHEKTAGRRVILATGADAACAERVATHLGLFDDVLASDGVTNLTGRRKRQAIEQYCQEHQLSEYAYLGDSRADLPVWRKAAEVYCVAPSMGLLDAIRRRDRVPNQILTARAARGRAVLTAMRPHQWAKNLLLFAPVVLAHQVFELPKLIATILAFVAFSLCASSVYVLNDLFDIEDDRHHPKKRFRPFASGDLPLSWGAPLTASLAAAGLVIANLALPGPFVGALIGYLCLTTAYSFALKRRLMLDVIALSGLYTLRLFAGGLATDVVVSEWLLMFSMFLFTSLAFVKRYAELTRLTREGITTARGRGYLIADLSVIEAMGTSSGYLAVLIMALYLKSDIISNLYRNVWLLWLICPLLQYWISRLWLLAKRGELCEDPVVFATSDRVSLLIAACVIGLLAMSVMPWL